MTSPGSTETRMELSQPSADVQADVAFFTGTLGFRLQSIYPADNPEVAVVSGHGITLRLERHTASVPGVLYMAGDVVGWPDVTDYLLHSPGGTEIRLEPLTTALAIPAPDVSFEIRRLSDSDAWVVGRAGMHYRDLVPSRLGGHMIASHIRIPQGGPVPDMVHYHSVGFQLICCLSGWVRLVYEDQGPPFVLQAGDCVTQPPTIRHRVLEASDSLEVLEIAVPAQHMTTIDHAMQLPTKTLRPERLYGGQQFCRHCADQAQWLPVAADGFERCDTAVATRSAGAASVAAVRSSSSGSEYTFQVQASVFFGYVVSGELMLEVADEPKQMVEAGEAFVIPRDRTVTYRSLSGPVSLVEVTLRGSGTHEHTAV